MKNQQEINKELVIEAFDTLFNKRNYAAAEKFWSPNYIQHSAVVPAGRAGLFNLVKNAPKEFRWEQGVIMADNDMVMIHSRYSGRGTPKNMIGVDILKIKDGVFVEHWDVLQDEAAKEESNGGLSPMPSMKQAVGSLRSSGIPAQYPIQICSTARCRYPPSM
jgi:predicted SnoaL-like aldol condensation-catalyzing enzyme